MPGHGRCKTSEEKTWILESHADSDWSGNKSHRRSTSCGLHVMNGQYMFGSSRTQRVVSLSSCEAELHALVSTLSDGIYIRRCFEFVIGAKIQHILLTDSSSARQLISRQGTGKAKHVSGKILWIQDHVRQAFVDISQISTTWNVADIGTKPLSKQRMQLLLHEVGVHSGNGEFRVGQEEFEQQSLRHTGGPQISKLAKAVARVIMVLGLEPLSVAGAGIPGDDLQCSADMVVQSNDDDHFWVFFWMAVLFLLWTGFVYKAWRFAKDVRGELSSHSYQLADGDRCYGNQEQKLNSQQESLSALEGWVANVEGQITMVSDYSESVHHGLVELGGFTRLTDLTPDERRCMYSAERANLVSRNTMGADYYMRCVRQQFGGGQGQNTDGDEAMESESDSQADDPPTAENAASGSGNGPSSSPTGMLNLQDDLVTQLNAALARESYRDASIIQHMMMDLLDLSHQNGFYNTERRNRFLGMLNQRFTEMRDFARFHGNPDVATVYDSYLNSWRRFMH